MLCYESSPSVSENANAKNEIVSILGKESTSKAIFSASDRAIQVLSCQNGSATVTNLRG